MSARYTADGKRRSSMTHAKYSWTCPCGRKVRGNGGKSGHQRACDVWAEAYLAMLDRLLADEALIYTATRAGWEAERDQLRERLGKTP